MSLNVEKLRAEFPVLSRTVNGKPLVYLDNAATTLKPKPVVAAVTEHFLNGAANVHRGLHFLSEAATRQFEDTREKARKFINARETQEIIFTTGTTGGINLVALSFGRKFLQPGDEVLITHMEHHSNIVPWQMLQEEKGIKLKVAPINDAGELILEEFEKLITPRTRLISVVWISNSLGTVNPVEDIIKMAKARDIRVLVDAAQAAAHLAIDVQKLDVDFLVYSGHKLYGPTGVGVLYAKRHLLEAMPPVFGGGDMIRSVSFDKTVFAPPPYKFEAGTPDIGGVIGLGATLDYVTNLGIANLAAREAELLAYGTGLLQDIKGVRLIGTAKKKTSILAFTLKSGDTDIHPHDIGTLLDQDGVAVRAGHHCTQPLMARFGVPATARASMAFYNTKEELDQLAAGIKRIIEVFK